MKHKIITWAVLIIFAFFIWVFPKLFEKPKNNVKEKEIITMDLDNISIDDKLLLYKKQKIYSNGKDSDIIVGKNLNLMDSYEIINDGFYTPILCYYNFKFSSNINNFVEYYDNNKYISLKLLFKSIENETNENDLKLYKNNIYFPSENNAYYKTMVDLIILSLNDFKKPDDDKLKELTKEAYVILNKCNKYDVIENISSLNKFMFVFSAESNEKKLLNYNTHLSLIIPYETINKSYDLYLKKDKKEQVVNIISENKDIYNILGYRHNYMKNNINSNRDSLLEINLEPNIVEYSEVLNETINDNNEETIATESNVIENNDEENDDIDIFDIFFIIILILIFGGMGYIFLLMLFD